MNKHNEILNKLERIERIQKDTLSVMVAILRECGAEVEFKEDKKNI